eukprot:Skav203652  [mRNA]  locus=scaffold2755:23567:26983:+ [translate_table: standard]
MSGDDLSNFFYTFRVGEDRISRNFLEWRILIKIAQQFSSFPTSLAIEPYVYACLATLAMGDSAACEYAQTSHLSLALQCGSISPEELVTLHGQIPRGDLFSGIIIDDLIFLEIVAKDVTTGLQSDSRRQRMHSMYTAVGLDAHPDKGFSQESEASFWGADVDGCEGLVRGNMVRAISLCWVTSKVASMKVCSVNLLEVIAGGFVSLFGYRRRLMSLLDWIYAVQGNHDERHVLRLPEELVEELWSLVILCPLAVTDLRAAFGETMFMVDSSSWGDAVVAAEVSKGMCKELHRNALRKSAWTRLLTPWKACLREKGLLAPEDELPSGEAEEFGGLLQQDCRFAIGSDSQVSLGAILKGRSASKALNQVLRHSLPHTLGFGTYSCGGYIPSALNPCDDPTRGVPLRSADLEFPDWWLAADNGDTKPIDDFLYECNLSATQTAGYPCLGELTSHVNAAIDEPQRSRINSMHKKVKRKLIARASAKKKIAPVEEENLLADEANYFFSSDVRESFEFFGKDLIIFGHDSSWPPVQPGLIDLYSGKKGYARAASRLGAPWILCLDILDGPRCNLLDKEVRGHVERLIRGGACLGFSAAPICSSFSRAITPAVRSREHLKGVPWLKGNMLTKVRDGNSHSEWLAFLISLCISMSILFWVENPDSSFLWLQRCWVRLGSQDSRYFFKTDFCRYGTPWRKRARFLTSCRLRGIKELCKGGHSHIVLRGRSKFHKMAWTKVAEPYPNRLCRTLAHAMCGDLSLLRTPGLQSCRCDHMRIGEAKNPGPRRKTVTFKNVDDLDNVELIRPETLAMGKFHWDKFCSWLSTNLGDETSRSIWIVPELCGKFLSAYGRLWYGEGGALYAFRHLVVYCQRTYPVFKGKIQEAWNLIAKWEELEPVTHRKPLPWVMVQAMVCLSIRWNWIRFAGVVLIAFHACARPGEVLKALRKHLVLGQDVGEDGSDVCFLQINKPKPGRRGLGRTQHARIRGSEICRYLARVFGPLKGSEALYPGSAGAFRTRWNTVLRQLGVPSHFNLTPGCLRAGGTVYLYKLGTPIMDLLWFLRLKNVETLQHYLQEISTEVTMIDLPEDSRMLIKFFSFLYSHFLP